MGEVTVYEVATSQGMAPKPVQELVQEMSSAHDDIPQRYLNRLPVNENRVDDDDASLPMMEEAAMIDFGLLSSPLPSQRADELAKFRSLLTSWGCFQLVNHGMSSSFLDRIRQASKQFFALPQDEKNKYARPADKFDGYGTDTAYGEGSVDWNDRVELLAHPVSKRFLQYWPPNLRDILNEFTVKSKQVAVGLLKAMALSLDLEENIFMDMYGEEAIMLARFNYYPPCPRPDLVFGSRPHSDGTAVTILLQDDQVEALQVLKDDEWFRVASIPHALFINVGDQMEMMSNGLFKSAFHRVVTNAKKERISLVMFCSPEADNEIKPPTKLVTLERPQLFKTVKNYSLIFYQNDPLGDKRPLDLVRLQNV